MEKLAKILSGVFSPLLIPTYAMVIALWTTYLNFADIKTRVTVLLVTFAFTCMVPVISIFVLNRIGTVKDPSLNNRQDRAWPMGVTIFCYIGVALYLVKAHAPLWLSLFVLSGAFAAITAMIVNFRWKISGHSTAMGGITAFTFFLCYRTHTIYNNDWIFIGTLFVAGCVMTSRLLLNRHTPAQVYAGFFNGVFWVTLGQLLSGAN